MAKEKVFIVLSHRHSLKPRSNGEWQVHESVEFVSSLKNRHYQMSTAIGDYLNRKMITGSAIGMTDYDHFEAYVRKKYKEQMTEIDQSYSSLRAPVVAAEDATEETVVDEFGNTRAKTVFDVNQ